MSPGDATCAGSDGSLMQFSIKSLISCSRQLLWLPAGVLLGAAPRVSGNSGVGWLCSVRTIGAASSPQQWMQTTVFYQVNRGESDVCLTGLKQTINKRYEMSVFLHEYII